MLQQHYTSGVITCELVVLPSWHCFRNPDALDLSTQCPVVIEEGTRRAVARHRLKVWRLTNMFQFLKKYRAGLQLLRQVCEMCFVIQSTRYVSRAEEEVMREECDIHHTRSIKTNSAVNLGRKPGLDLCCDLLQHVQGVPRTCFLVFTLSYER